MFFFGKALRLLRKLSSSGECLPAEKNIYFSSMDEREETFLCRGTEMPLTLRPFEIRTLRVTE